MLILIAKLSCLLSVVMMGWAFLDSVSGLGGFGPLALSVLFGMISLIAGSEPGKSTRANSQG